MKNLGIILLCYNLACLLVLNTDWYAKVWQTLNTLDTIVYFASVIVFFTKYRLLTKLQRDCFIFGGVYLLFKVVDEYQRFNYQTFLFWNLLIIATPFIFWIERNFNWDRFKK